MKKLCKWNRFGQSTTELAIFAFVLLLVFAFFLKYGQLMNKQQEVRMHAFRQALNKAYYDYAGGEGFGGSAYTSIKNIHLINPFRSYYDGSMRQSLSGGAVVLWDPDIMYIEEDDDEAKPHTYVEVDGIEKDLGVLDKSKDAGEDEDGDKVQEIFTDADTRVHRSAEAYQVDTSDIVQNVQAHTDEHLTTTIRIKREGGAIEDQVIEQDNTYVADETWITPWE